LETGLAYHADQLPLSATPPADRRAALFRESPLATVERWALSFARALKPQHISGLPNLLRLCLSEMLAPNYGLPDPERALANPPGLAGVVHELSLPTLLAGYRRGLYPLAHLAPLKWWSPAQRSLLDFRNFHISNNLARLMRQRRYSVTFDRDFDAVISACAGPRPRRWHLTWITPRIMRVYAEAYDAGHAHSFEVWNKAGELVAGGYGIAVGGSFTSESQFTRASNASRIGMTVLNWHLAHWGYRFNDGKLMGPLWANMGFRNVPRREFLTQLADAIEAPGKSGRWQVEADIETISRWQPDKTGRAPALEPEGCPTVFCAGA
jgi:leucyl/phenylalanyl-tRNA--protein transferase